MIKVVFMSILLYI